MDQWKNQQFGDLLQAVGLLTAEVRDLAADNRQMRADLEAMRGQQHATNQLTSVLKLTTTPTISSATLTVTPPPLPTSSTMWPSRALLEAMRELPFLHDYPSLAGFAIPDFRYPVLACVYPGNTIFDPVPPTILFANAAMCRLSGYTFRELVGALVTKVVVMQESARLKMGPFLSNKDPLSLSPVYSFNTLIRSRSGRLWRTLADSTQFFFGQNGTPKHIVVNLTQWEEGHLREGEVIDHWEGMTSGPSFRSTWTASPSPAPTAAAADEPPAPPTLAPEIPTSCGRHCRPGRSPMMMMMLMATAASPPPRRHHHRPGLRVRLRRRRRRWR